MASLADSEQLIGFFSYSREDDEDSKGALSALRERIQRELRGQLGRSATDFRLWQDKAAIAPGTLWETEIKAAVAQSVFFIPIVTPTTLRSPYCRYEFDAFLGREQALGRSDLIFPLLYITVPALRDEALVKASPVLSMIAARQWVDWREFRFRDVYSSQVGEAVESLCSKIVEALSRADSWSTEQEQRRERAQLAAITARLSEEKRQAEDAARLVQEQYQASEAARLAQEKRQVEEANKTEEERRKVEDENREKAEQARAAQLALEQAQTEREQRLAARLAEEKRQAEAAERQREEAERRRATPQPPPTEATEALRLERRTLAKVATRVVLLLAIGYFFITLERVNLAYAMPAMIRDLPFSVSSGFGIAYLSYVAFMVPSSLALLRFGTRRWLALILLTSGIVAAATAFIGSPAGFDLNRLVLGATAAGFLPGAIFCLTLWVPTAYRGRVFGCFFVAAPMVAVLGRLISNMLLAMNGFAGLKGWQWVFILEAVPAILLAGAVWRNLTDQPDDARWLAPEQRAWLTSQLRGEQATGMAGRPLRLLPDLANAKLVALAVVFAGGLSASGGIINALAQVVAVTFGWNSVQAGILDGIPILTGIVVMLWYGQHSDRKMERARHAMLALALAAIGAAASGLSNDLGWRIISLSIGEAAALAFLPVFWALATGSLSGRPAAPGIAAINALAGLASFFVPALVAAIAHATGGPTWGMLFVAATVVPAIVLIALLRRGPALAQPPS